MSAHSEERVDRSAQAWGDLWRRGVLHSCATGIDGNYDGAIAGFWREGFAELGAGDRLVDMATGNGALLLLAKQEADRCGIRLDLHGVDIAPIQPDIALQDGGARMAGITFHPHTDMAELPFADGSVALACSQFGFEYAASAAVVAEIARVLADGGRARLVMHSDDSLVARTAPAQRHGIDYLLAAPLIARLGAIATLMASAARDQEARRVLAASAEAGEARAAFNASVEALLAEIDAHPDAHVLQQATLQVRRVLEAASRGDAGAFAAFIADWRGSLEAERIRLQDLARALVDEARLAEIRSWFEAAGMVVDTGRMRQAADAPMGWTLVARRG